MDSFLVLLHSTLRMSTPIALAALGGLFAHRAGVLNVALEGMMLASAFTGVIVNYLTGSLLLTLIAGVAVSIVFSLIFALFGLSLKGNLTIVGLAINTLVSGLSAFILQIAFGQRGTFTSEKLIGFPEMNLPIIRHIPIINQVLNKHTPIVYISIIALFVCHILLNHTKIGLYIRIVGENKNAAESVGLSVTKIQYLAVSIGGVLCGLAGLNISLENVHMFVENMTSGRGFIALAAIYSGNGTAIGTYVFSLLFGMADAAQIQLQGINIPGAFIQMIPYIAIVAVLTIIGLAEKKKGGMLIGK